MMLGVLVGMGGVVKVVLAVGRVVVRDWVGLGDVC